MKSHSILRDGHQIKLLKGGAEFFPELIRALEAARQTLSNDRLSLSVSEATAKVREGVNAMVVPGSGLVKEQAEAEAADQGQQAETTTRAARTTRAAAAARAGPWP